MKKQRKKFRHQAYLLIFLSGRRRLRGVINISNALFGPGTLNAKFDSESTAGTGSRTDFSMRMNLNENDSIT